MKKLLALLAVLVLMTGSVLAEAAVPTEENAAPTFEEFEMYLDTLRDAALAAPQDSLTVQQSETGLEVSSALVTLRIADETLRDTSAVLSAALKPGQECPRGVMIGDSLDDVLSVYPNDNPTLLGSYYDAALFVSGEKPEVSAGWVLRDGQRVTEVVYTVYHWTAEGVICCGIRYTADQGEVTDIQVFGMDDVIAEEEALAAIDEVAAMQEAAEYFAYPQDPTGANVSAFDREDLIFGGMDFLSLTMESAIEALGEPNVDEWMEDSTGEYLRLRQWEDVSILFVYDGSKQFLRVDSMTINGETLEGPRGVRVGDKMETVINRFRHDEPTMLESGTALYGDGENAPYGVLAHSEVTDTVTYTVPLDDGQTVTWQNTFANGVLQEMRLMLR